MQLQFHRSPVPFIKPVKWENKNVEQTQELRIHDAMPDIGRVLGAWGQVILRSKEWQRGEVTLSGGVQVSVLYIPEDGAEPQMVETWIPFQVKWDIPETDSDGTVCACCLLRSADARNTSARKMLVRVNVGVSGQLWAPAEQWQYAPADVPEDVCLLKRCHRVDVPREAGEKAFSLEEELVLPGSAPKMEKLLHCHLQPELIEQKIMSDKVVFRGMGLLHVLYRGEDGQLHTWDFELPFSQYGELSGEYGDGTQARLTPAVTSLETELDPEGRVRMKAGLVGQYLICQSAELEVIEDAYSPKRQVTPLMEDMFLFAVTDAQQKTVPAAQTLQADGTPVDVMLYPDHPHVQQLGKDTQLQMTGQFQVLYRDGEGQYRTAVSRWENGQPVTDADAQQVLVRVAPTGRPGCTADGTGLTVSGDILTDMMTASFRELPAVAGLDMAEAAEPDPERPSLILRRAGQDSLWEIAKGAGSTVEAIMEANRLDAEPAPDRMLLIPVL